MTSFFEPLKEVNLHLVEAMQILNDTLSSEEFRSLCKEELLPIDGLGQAYGGFFKEPNRLSEFISLSKQLSILYKVNEEVGQWLDDEAYHYGYIEDRKCTEATD